MDEVLLEEELAKPSIKDRLGVVLARFKKNQMKIKTPKGSASWEIGSEITPIPPLPGEEWELVEIYPIRKPYTYARILYNTKEYEYVYEVIEPPLDEKERAILNGIKDALSKVLRYDWYLSGSKKDKEEFLKESVKSYLESRGVHLDRITYAKILYYIIRDFINYQAIDPIIQDENVEDISCDGVDIPLFIYHKKYESIKTAIRYVDEEELNSFIVYLGQKCGKQISVSDPILDGTTPEGHRVQATYGREVTTRGATFTIRRFKEKPFTPTELVKYGTASPEIVAYLWIAVEHGDSMMIIGGPATGKTATLNAVAIFIPPTAKIVSMEDTREINLPHQNWIPGTTRSGSGEKGVTGKAAGEIDMYDLVRAALRQRPNYIIVGEVRGRETYVMFQAMATGHTTYSTMHADSIKSMIHRLENPPINTPRILLTALNEVVILTYTKVRDQYVRRIKEVTEIIGFEGETNELITNVVFEWDHKRDRHIFKGHSYLFDRIMEMKNMTHDEMDEEFQRRVDIVRYWVKRDMVDYREIWQTITDYYKDPIATAEKIREELRKIEEEELQREFERRGL